MNEDIYKIALEKWGKEAQLTMIFEELGELITALAQYIRDRVIMDSLVGEIVDVEIMLDQLKYIFEIKEEYINKRKKETIERLRVKLGL